MIHQIPVTLTFCHENVAATEHAVVPAAQESTTPAADTPQSRRLLIDESPLQVLPSLAVVLGGLNEALILQQLHYLMRLDKHVIDGVSWVYNTYEQWQQHFPFWSIDTIKRAIRHLERDGFVRSTQQWNRSPWDQTKWYTIVYDRLEARCTALISLIVPSDALCPDAREVLPSSMEASCPPSLRLPAETSPQDPPPPSPPPVTETPHEVVVVESLGCGTEQVASEESARVAVPEPSVAGVSLTLSSSSGPLTPGFLGVWEAYPPQRRERKWECFALWEARGLEGRAEEMVDKLRRLRCTQWQARELRFIPAIHTWLHYARYDDDPVPLPVTSALVTAPNPFDPGVQEAIEAQCDGNLEEVRKLLRQRRWHEEAAGVPVEAPRSPEETLGGRIPLAQGRSPARNDPGTKYAVV